MKLGGNLRHAKNGQWDLNPSPHITFHRGNFSDNDMVKGCLGHQLLAEGKRPEENYTLGQNRYYKEQSESTNLCLVCCKPLATVYSFIGKWPSTVYAFALFGEPLILPSGRFPDASDDWYQTMDSWSRDIVKAHERPSAIKILKEMLTKRITPLLPPKTINKLGRYHKNLLAYNTILRAAEIEFRETNNTQRKKQLELAIYQAERELTAASYVGVRVAKL